MEMTWARISSREMEECVDTEDGAGTGRECVADWRMATLTTRERIREVGVILIFERRGRKSVLVSVSVNE